MESFENFPLWVSFSRTTSVQRTLLVSYSLDSSLFQCLTRGLNQGPLLLLVKLLRDSLSKLLVGLIPVSVFNSRTQSGAPFIVSKATQGLLAVTRGLLQQTSPFVCSY
jgi:hypothetical protein